MSVPATLRVLTAGHARRRGPAFRSIRVLLAIALVCIAWAAPSSATVVDAVAMNGQWAPLEPTAADTRAAGPRLRDFDPGALHSFGRPPGGALVLLHPRAGAWPAGPLVLSITSPGFQRFTLQLPGAPAQRARMIEVVESRWPGHGRLVFDIAEPPPGGAPLRLHVDARDAIPSAMTFELRSVPDHVRADARWLAFATACLTTMVATALIALVFGLRLRDGVFLFYCIYVLTYAAIQGAQTGYFMHPLEWERVATTVPAWGGAVTAVSVVAAVLFLDRFAPLEHWLPKMRRWLWLYCGLMLVLPAMGYVPGLQPVVRQLINPMLILGGPLLLGTAAVAAWRGSRYAAIFLLGWLPLLGVTVLGSLQLYGLARHWTWASDAALAAGAFEAIVLSLGLAERAASVRRQRDQAQALADLDPLTEVLNRRAWKQQVQSLIGPVGPGLSVLFLDIDRFKQVNDRVGHDGGDRVLVKFVAVLRRAVRERNLVGRYGGEEFVVALPATTPAQARTVAERIRAGLREEASSAAVGDSDIPITVSVGVATLRPGESLDGLLRRADAAVYVAKERGRDCVVVAEEATEAVPAGVLPGQ